MTSYLKKQKKFGGNIRIILSGGAPLSISTHNFVSVTFNCPVLQGYGLTETCGGACITDRTDREFGKVGPPLPCNEVVLVSVPDMNYLVENGHGEVWLRGNNISSGYYKDEQKTKEDFDENGWFHTGDIGHWNEDGTLSIIDRKKNIFKLSQGEYIVAELLEGIYNKNKYTTQLWIYGSSNESTLIAVGAVNHISFQNLAKSEGITGEVEELCKNQVLKQIILDEINSLAKTNNRQPFEYIKKKYIFIMKNLILTTTWQLLP